MPTGLASRRGRSGIAGLGAVAALIASGLILDTGAVAYSTGADGTAAQAPRQSPATPTTTDPASPLPPVECVQLLRLARIQSDMGSPDRAAETLREALERFPEEAAPAMAAVGFTRHRSGDGAFEQLAASKRTWLLDPSVDVELATLVRTLRSAEATTEELGIVRDRLDRATDTTSAESVLRARAAVRYRLGDLDGTMDALAALTSIREDDPEVRWARIGVALERDRHDDAIADLEHLTANDADSRVPALALLIEVLAETGNTERVTALTQSYLERPRDVDFRVFEPVMAHALERAGWSLFAHGATDAAAKTFEAVLKLEGDADRTARTVALLFGGVEARRELAAARKEQFAKLDPEMLLSEASKLLAAGDDAAAFEILEHAAPKVAKDEIAWFNLGLAATRLERWEVAVDAYTRALALRPDRDASRLSLVTALHALGRWEASIDAAEELLRRSPGTYQAQYYLYACHTELGNDEAAKEALAAYDAGRAAAQGAAGTE